MSVLTLAGILGIASLGVVAVLVAIAAIGSSLGADAKETIEARLERARAERLIVEREACEQEFACQPGFVVGVANEAERWLAGGRRTREGFR